MMRFALGALLVAGCFGLLLPQSASAFTKTFTYEKTITKPVLLQSTQCVNQVISQPIVMEKSVCSPAVIERTIEQPVLFDRVVESPILMDKVLTAPAVLDSCAPAVIERPAVLDSAPCVINKPVGIRRTIETPIIIDRDRSHLIDFNLSDLLHMGLL
jgi:hypothetical protein